MVKSKHIEKSNDKAAKKVQEIELQPEVYAAPDIEAQVQENNEQRVALNGLILMLDRLVGYFQQCADTDDRETLIFGLCHLFSHVDALYCETLPELSSIIHTRPTVSAIKTRMAFRYALWTHLQQMQQHIERIESLCHLLNRTIPHLLSMLDTSDIAQPDREMATPMRHLNDYVQEDTERWQQAYELLTTRLNAWQERNEERLTFASSVTADENPGTASVNVSHSTAANAPLDSSPVIIRPLLTGIDASLMLVLDSAGAIYGDIVPDFQGVARGDDEGVATLLFDLMQQADLLLIQCDTLYKPLQDLIRHYMLFE